MAVPALVEPLLAAWLVLRRQVVELDRQLLALVRGDETCRRLMTVPGVGAVTAVTFVATIEDRGIFRRSRSIGAYLGLTPTRCQSGKTDHSGRISKRGDRLLRSHLVEAAAVLLTQVERWSSLKAWGARLMKRIGFKKATGAVARKLAATLHAMWRDGTAFQPSRLKEIVA